MLGRLFNNQGWLEMTECVATQSPGTIQLPLSDLAQTLAYSGGFISTITVVYQGTTYVQTFTNDGTNITEISQWVPQ